MKSKDRKRNNNKNNTNDYKLESGAPARPKFLGSGSSNNNKNNNIYNKKKLIWPKFL
jgi:hypothetical protein